MAANDTTDIIHDAQVSKSIVDDLYVVTQRFIIYLPLIFLIFGLIGFIGNVFTYLQPELRSNTCCIYSLCGSIVDIINLSVNLFPNYLVQKYGISIPWSTSSTLCKLGIFLLIFLPNLSINFLLMSTIDRFTSTCQHGSILRRLNQLKMIPYAIILTILFTGLVSIRGPILYQLMFGFWCQPSQPTTNSILFIILNGLLSPLLMLLFILLTYRNVCLSRRRVGAANMAMHYRSRIQFIIMIFCQVLVTGFISLQWIVMFTFYNYAPSFLRSMEQWSIVYFVYGLTNYCYYLNNVKSFYLSIAVSRLFRRIFIKSVIRLFSEHICRPFQAIQRNVLVNIVPKRRHDNIPRY